MLLSCTMRVSGGLELWWQQREQHLQAQPQGGFPGERPRGGGTLIHPRGGLDLGVCGVPKGRHHSVTRCCSPSPTPLPALTVFHWALGVGLSHHPCLGSLIFL